MSRLQLCAIALALAVLPAFANAAAARNFIFAPGLGPDGLHHVVGKKPCTGFHGVYNDVSVLSPQDECEVLVDPLPDIMSLVPDTAVTIALTDGNDEADDWEIVHVQEAALLSQSLPSTPLLSLHDEITKHTQALYTQIASEVSFSSQIQRVFRAGGATEASHEHRLLSSSSRPQLLFASSDKSGFYAIPRGLAPIADQLFPPTTVLTQVPRYSLPWIPSQQGARMDVPSWLNSTLRNLAFSPLVNAIIEDVETSAIQQHVRHLTGEDGKAGWATRHSFTQGARDAAAWIKSTVDKQAGTSCEFVHHNEGFAPNIVCTFRGTQSPDEVVVMGAHYDSRGTFGHVRAPGGDDDASGTSALLSLAQLFKAYGIRFKRTVQLVFFSGEEQGLWGSRAYAKMLRDNDTNVRFMLQADMLGYHLPGEPMQIAFPDRYDTIEARWLVGNLSHIYQPNLQVGTTPACCSDHQSFDQQGFVSTWVFERNGPIADPKYHNSLDLSDREGYDFDQIAAIAKVMFATVLTVAEFTL